MSMVRQLVKSRPKTSVTSEELSDALAVVLKWDKENIEEDLPSATDSYLYGDDHALPLGAAAIEMHYCRLLLKV